MIAAGHTVAKCACAAVAVCATLRKTRSMPPWCPQQAQVCCIMALRGATRASSGCCFSCPTQDKTGSLQPLSLRLSMERSSPATGRELAQCCSSHNPGESSESGFIPLMQASNSALCVLRRVCIGCWLLAPWICSIACSRGVLCRGRGMGEDAASSLAAQSLIHSVVSAA